jgi:putative membrane protein
MFQHLTMMFAVAPLWLIGTPAWLLEPMLGRPLLRRAGYVLTRPVAAFVVGNLIVAIWHLPGPYDAALRHEALHVVQHLSFLVAALLVWWPVLGPLPAWPRLSPPVQCLYLFLESIPGSIIGAFITLAAPGVYDFYDRAPRIWGIDLATDQQMAGLLMWVGAQLLYLLWITIVFFQWASGEETKEWSGVGQQPRAFNRQPPSARVAPGRLSGSR